MNEKLNQKQVTDIKQYVGKLQPGQTLTEFLNGLQDVIVSSTKDTKPKGNGLNASKITALQEKVRKSKKSNFKDQLT